MPVSEDLWIGTELLGYRIEELIGRGGMSVVYRATDLRLKRQVAIKLLAPELAQDEGFRKRFLAESELAASLEHPHILPVYHAGEVNGVLYIAMRLVPTGDLKHRLRAEGPLAPERAVQLIAEVADALDAAHDRGLVHRDVKPSNVLISEQAGTEHAYVADFGLATRIGDVPTATSTGQIVGSVDYVAPEQIRGGNVDRRADVYALGCLLFESLTGEVPFSQSSELAVLFAHLHATPPSAREHRPDLPEAFDRVVAKALEKDPDKRYEGCGQLIDAAREALGLGAVSSVRRRTPLLLAAGGLVVAIAAAAAFAATNSGDSALALRGNTLVRIDPETDRVSAVIEVGEKPSAIAVAGGTAWVYNLGDSTISEIDTTTNSIRRTTAVSTGPVAYGYHTGPILAANSRGAWLVGTRRDGTGVVTRVGLDGSVQEFVLNSTPLGVAASNTSVWVLGSFAPRPRCPLFWDWDSNTLPASRSDAVLRVSPSTGQVLARVALRRCGLTGVARTERSVWVFGMGWSELIRVDARASRVTGRAQVGSGPGTPGGGGAPASGGGTVWVHAIDGGGRLVGIDPTTLRATRSISSVPGRYGSLVYGRRSLWWNDSREGVVLRFDPETKKIVSSVRVAPESRRSDFDSSAIATGAGSIWVTVTPAFLD